MGYLVGKLLLFGGDQQLGCETKYSSLTLIPLRRSSDPWVASTCPVGIFRVAECSKIYLLRGTEAADHKGGGRVLVFPAQKEERKALTRFVHNPRRVGSISLHLGSCWGEFITIRVSPIHLLKYSGVRWNVPLNFTANVWYILTSVSNCSPSSMLNAWRENLIRYFGAKMGYPWVLSGRVSVLLITTSRG